MWLVQWYILKAQTRFRLGFSHSAFIPRSSYFFDREAHPHERKVKRYKQVSCYVNSIYSKARRLSKPISFWLNIWRGCVLANVVTKIPIFIFLLYIDTAMDVVIFRATLPVFQRQDLHLTLSWNHKFNIARFDWVSRNSQGYYSKDRLQRCLGARLHDVMQVNE